MDTHTLTHSHTHTHTGTVTRAHLHRHTHTHTHAHTHLEEDDGGGWGGVPSRIGERWGGVCMCVCVCARVCVWGSQKATTLRKHPSPRILPSPGLTVQLLQIIPERDLVIAAGQGDLEHLAAGGVSRQAGQRLLA